MSRLPSRFGQFPLAMAVHWAPPHGRAHHAYAAGLLLLMVVLSSGCAALTNPTLNGIPVRRLPTEMLTAPRREHLQTVPLSALRQDPPDEYLLGPDDVLGIYIAGVLPPTFDNQQIPAPPVNYPSRTDPLAAGLPPSVGYPVQVDKDGTVQLPLIEPLRVEGLSVKEVSDKIKAIYVDKRVAPAGGQAVIVSLMQPRAVRVYVVRQEVGGFGSGSGLVSISANNVKQGTGHVVTLKAYENDLLNALAQTSGMPGLDAYDGIYIFRGGMSHAELTARLGEANEDWDPTEWSELGIEIIHIPTRWPAWEPLPFQPQDILLQEGDVVYIDARTRDVFYTGGLLPRGEFPVPRDYDLDVLEAVAQVRGTLLNGAFGGNNLNGVLVQPGIGNPNPSALTVVRRTPNGGQMPISVDLNRALRDPRERIMVLPGDVLILQETAGEALARYVADVFTFGFVANVVNRGSATGTTSLVVP